MNSSASIPARASVPAAPRKLWSAGTLTYTTAGLVLLFCWLLWGDFAWSMKDRAIPPTMQLLLKRFGATDLLTGLIFGSLPSILGLLVGPVVSYRSDRYRSRWGRRLPFLLAATPFMVLGVAGLGFSPAIGSHADRLLGAHSPGLDSSVLISFALFWMVFEMASVVTNAVYGALVNDVVPHALLGRFYGLFRALSLIAGIVFNYWIFGHAETLYFWIFLGIAALYGVGFLLMCLNVKEGSYPSLVPMDAGRPPGGPIASAQTYLQECFGNRYYLWFFAASVLSGMANVPFNIFSVFFAKSIGLGMDTYGKCLALTYLISLLLAYPIGWLVDRFHPLRLTILCTLLYAVQLVASYFFTKDAWTFSVSLVAHGVISGTYGTASASLGQRLLPRAEFAQFASAGGMITAVFWMVLPPGVGFLLDHAHHQYRYTFLMSAALGLAGFAALLVLHAKFMKLGGLKNYIAPE